MPVYVDGEVPLYYEHEGHGPPLVLIAGYTCDLTQWDTVRTELSEHYRLLLIDNRDAGRSGSSGTPYSISQMANDIAGLIEAMGIGRSHILGHSMGGAIAQTLAAAYPQMINKLILSNSLIKFRPAITLAFRWLLALREQGYPIASLCEGVLPWIFSNQFLNTPANIKAVLEQMLANPHPQTLAGQQRQFDALIRFDSRPWFGNITAPTLVIAGAEDICASPENSQELADGIRGAKLVMLPGMGHVPLTEKPAEFTRIVLDFLK